MRLLGFPFRRSLRDGQNVLTDYFVLTHAGRPPKLANFSKLKNNTGFGQIYARRLVLPVLITFWSCEQFILK